MIENPLDHCWLFDHGTEQYQGSDHDLRQILDRPVPPVPWLVLQEGYWDDEASTRTECFFVIDAATAKIECYAPPTVAFRANELEEMMVAAGFENIRQLPSLLGATDQGDSGTNVVVGSKDRQPNTDAPLRARTRTGRWRSPCRPTP